MINVCPQSFLTDPIFSTGECLEEVNGGIQWPWTQGGTTVYKSCSEAGSIFRAGPKASRKCSDQGVWEGADLFSCTLIADAKDPFLLIWFVINDAEYSNELEQIFMNSVSPKLIA